jgi:hypothetical protein
VLREHLGGPLGGQLRGQLSANFRRAFGGLSSDSMLLVRYRGQTFSSRLQSAGVAQLFSVRDHLGEAVARSTLRGGTGPLSFELGVEGAYNWLDTRNAFVFGGTVIPLPNARASVSETRGEASGKLVWKPGAMLEVEGGLRLEASHIAAQADTAQQRSLLYPKPRLMLTLNPSATDQLRFRLEREVGQLDFNNFVASSALDTGAIRVGNNGIVPQQSWTSEIVYERRFWSSGTTSVSWRHSWIADAIDRVPVRNPADPRASFDAPGNIGTASLDVLTMAVTTPLDQLGIAHAQLRLSGRFQWSNAIDPTTGETRFLTGINPAEYALEFRQDLPSLHASWGVSLLTHCWTGAAKSCGRSIFRFNEVDRFDAEPALNIFAEYQPWPDGSLRFEANNILGQAFRRSIRLYSGPRDIFPLVYDEERKLTSSPSLKLSLRQSL